MTRGRATLAYLLLVLLTLIFVVSAYVNVTRVQQQKDLLAHRQRDVKWMVSSLEIELLRFHGALERHLADGGAALRADAQLRADILRNRLGVLAEGAASKSVREQPGYADMVAQVALMLDYSDPVLDDTAAATARSVSRLRASLDGVQNRVHRFVSGARMLEGRELKRLADYLEDAWQSLYISVAGMLLSSLVIMAMLLVQIRHGRRLVKTARRALKSSQRKAAELRAEVASRKQAQALLELSESRFRGFAEAAADWFWETDTDDRFRYVSGRFEEVVGVAPAQALGKRPVELLPGLKGALVSAPRVISKGPPYPDIEEADVEWTGGDGRQRVLSVSGRPVLGDDGGLLGYRGAASDVTEHRALTKRISHQANHDALTGLVNRRQFEERLRKLLKRCRRDGSRHAVCYLDLDQFKIINDSCGHIAGDELLRQLGTILGSKIRRRDTLSRLGGDEFGVLMEHCTLEQASGVADILRQTVEDFQFSWEGKLFRVGISIGLVPVDSTSEDLVAVLRAADRACYAAKDQGRNRIHVYRPGDSEVARQQGELQWVTRIQRALDQDRFVLLMQEIMPLAEERRDGCRYELLLRMRDEDGALVAPGAFLPAAERYQLAPRIDRWVVARTLDWLTTDGFCPHGVGHFSINLSGQSLGDRRFTDFVVGRVREASLAAGRICFEITETAAISNLRSATRLMSALKDLGCTFALDDFGSGWSSFGYLRNLPVDYLKIDGLFVRDMAEDAVDAAMVRSINEIGHLMGKQTIAEFVESEAVLNKLRQIGVDYAQGHYIGMPRPLATVRPPSAADREAPGHYTPINVTLRGEPGRRT